MKSALSWLDTSSQDQQRMREMLNLFAETESRDELGIGQVRDAFSDLLFPGTSTLHTRARYLLVVPWCHREAEQRGLRGAALSAKVEHNERRFIATLKANGDLDGLIGRDAGVAVKTLPSAIYWGALGQFGIRTTDNPGAALGNQPAGAEADELAERAVGDWAPTLPGVPRGFPGKVDGGLELSRSEASWLRERLLLGAPGTLLSHLLQDDHCPDRHSMAPWLDAATEDTPEDLAKDLKHAELFSQAMHGAALLYNLLVAERYEKAGLTRVDQPVATYRAALGVWVDAVRAEPGWAAWDRGSMWDRTISKNARIALNLRVRGFVDHWLNAVINGEATDATSDAALRDLVRDRERAVKRAQSRFTNDKLLRTWSGHSGNRPLTYRWTQVRRILTDVHDGLEADDASS